MSRVKKSLIFFLLLFSLIACSQRPGIPTHPPVTETFTPYVGGTETALASEIASPTPWIAGTETAIANLTPTPWVAGTETALAIASYSPTPWVVGTQTAVAFSTPTPSALPTLAVTPFAVLTPSSLPEGTFSPVLYGEGPFLLIGGFKTDYGWLSSVHAAQYMNNETAYDFFSPNGFFQVPGGAPERSPVCENYYMRSSVVLPEPMVGVASGWIPQKRLTTELAADDPTYVQAVTEWFQAQGISPAEIHISRILQVDIEGDGINEVLLSASYFKDTSGHMVETGDYSIVLVRKVTGNTVVTVPLVKDYYVTSLPEAEMSYPKTYTLVDALDLNRDGTLEVIVGVSRWEGAGAIVYRVDGQNVREVLRAIC